MLRLRLISSGAAGTAKRRRTGKFRAFERLPSFNVFTPDLVPASGAPLATAIMAKFQQKMYCVLFNTTTCKSEEPMQQVTSLLQTNREAADDNDKSACML